MFELCFELFDERVVGIEGERGMRIIRCDCFGRFGRIDDRFNQDKEVPGFFNCRVVEKPPD